MRYCSPFGASLLFLLLTFSTGHGTFVGTGPWRSGTRCKCLLPRERMTANQFMVSSSSASSPTPLPETSPLPSNTFAGLVEQGLRERFGSGAARVIESWRLLDAGYEHFEFVGGQQDPPVEDSEDSNCRQHAASYLPGLPAKTFYDVDDFEWTSKLASHYKEIKDEFLQATADMDKLTREGNNIWAGATTEDAASYGEGWRTLVLYDRGTWDPVNCNIFPKAAQAVRDCGVPVVEAFFASMKPHTNIKMHSDFTNFVLTSHLALEIPESGNNKCRLSVGDDTRQWINGEMMLFDTSIMHDAVNESDETRYILMLRLWHPGLTDVEQQALQFVYDCLLVPELVSTRPEERFMGERKLEALRAFPEIKQTAKGFGSKKSNKKNKKRKGSGRGFGSQ